MWALAPFYLLGVLFCSTLTLVTATQQSMHVRQSSVTSGWQVIISRTWNVLGPFPIHAREQQYLSPSFPLNLSEPIDFSKKWPSSYADNGLVAWTQATAEPNGDLKVAFPDIRWSSLRATEGWAALQHHAVLHTTLKLIPAESTTTGTRNPPPPLLVHLKQGSYFTILDKVRSSGGSESAPPKWYAGDIYAMENVLPKAVVLPGTPSLTQETEYDIFVAGDYEIRLFGDPTAYGSPHPIQSLNIQVSFDESPTPVVHVADLNVVPNFIQGLAMGKAIGVGLRSVDQWWDVTSVALDNTSEKSISVRLHHPMRLAPTQTRIVPVEIVQSADFAGQAINLTISLSLVGGGKQDSSGVVLRLSLPVTHSPLWTATNYTNIKFTHFYANAMPTTFIAKPPQQENLGEPKPVLLALHGAGVDITRNGLWADALARQARSWVVVPTGRTSWGLDWHGPSAKDAWDAVEALNAILESRELFAPWKIRSKAPVILVGHSNGGQGAWFLASRFPDRVLAVIPAAAYIKSQQYIPWTLSRSAHYVDPALQAILQTSLTPDDNDLFLTNLVSTPVLAIHGGLDDNVPTWHSREYISTIKYLYPAANATLREDPGQPHFYDTVVNNPQVQAFIDSAVLAGSNGKTPPREFTLTVAIPDEDTSLHGFTIHQLEVPGRLGRLHVQLVDGRMVVRTTNVKSFGVNHDMIKGLASTLAIDDTQSLPTRNGVYTSAGQGKWILSTSSTERLISGRMQQFLTTKGPITFIVPDGRTGDELSIATRLAHDLASYHNLDSQILEYSQVNKERLGGGNQVWIARGVKPFVSQYLSAGPTVFGTRDGKFTVQDKPIVQPGAGLIFLHPSPFNIGHSLFLLGNDAAGLERAAKLFPIRTGVAVPDWVITGPKADTFGSGGILGAGVWGTKWTWNERFSWTDL